MPRNRRPFVLPAHDSPERIADAFRPVDRDEVMARIAALDPADALPPPGTKAGHGDWVMQYMLEVPTANLHPHELEAAEREYDALLASLATAESRIESALLSGDEQAWLKATMARDQGPEILRAARIKIETLKQKLFATDADEFDDIARASVPHREAAEAVALMAGLDVAKWQSVAAAAIGASDTLRAHAGDAGQRAARLATEAGAAQWRRDIQFQKNKAAGKHVAPPDPFAADDPDPVPGPIPILVTNKGRLVGANGARFDGKPIGSPHGVAAKPAYAE